MTRLNPAPLSKKTMTFYRLKERDRPHGILELDNELLVNVYGFSVFTDLKETTEALSDTWPKCWGAFFDVTTGDALFDQPDIYLWNDVFLALSPKAYEALSALLRGEGEWLQFDHMGTAWHLLSCHNKQDALFPLSEESIRNAGFEELEFPQFAAGQTGGSLTFKTDFDSCTHLYCSEFLKAAIEKHQLKGLDFISA